jgi:hypothetical protein
LAGKILTPISATKLIHPHLAEKQMMMNMLVFQVENKNNCFS